MARKSKGFGELLREQNTPQRSIEKMRKQMKEDPEWKDVEIISNPEGQEKMSEVLEAFVEPYLYTTHTYEQQQVLLTLACFAWNLSLLPADQQSAELDTILRSLTPASDQVVKEETREILEEMMIRKKDFFADNKRYILNFELQKGSQNPQLSVISTLFDDSEPNQELSS
jgi:hypothetical protein